MRRSHASVARVVPTCPFANLMPAGLRLTDCLQTDLSVELGRLRLPNPILVASGTFGYAREMEAFVDLARLGGIIPKTITREPRAGNKPWRTVETPAGLL